MIKLTILLRRRSGLTHEEFVRYHREQHAALFTSIKAVQDNVRKYVQQHTSGTAIPGLPGTTLDGATELWFDDLDGMGRVFQDAEYLSVIRPDEAKFLDLNGCEFLLTTEHPVRV